jgi:hypothetical protein
MSKIPFADQLTGVRIVKKINTSANNVTKKTETEVVLLSGNGTLRLLEPIKNKFRQEYIDQYGEQNGQLYMLYLTAADRQLIKKADKSMLYVFFNPEEEKQNLDFTNFTIINNHTQPNQNAFICKVLDIIDGGLNIDQRQLILVTQN